MNGVDNDARKSIAVLFQKRWNDRSKAPHDDVSTVTTEYGPTLSGPARPGPVTTRPVPGAARLKYINSRAPGACKPIQGVGV